MRCSSVDLPEPDGPTTATISPRSTANVDAVERPDRRGAGVLLDHVVEGQDGTGSCGARAVMSGTTTSSPSARSPVTWTQPSAKAPISTATSSVVPPAVTRSTA